MLVVFDWDGTLCDSTGRIVQAMQQAAAELAAGVPDDDAVREVIGLGLPEALARLFPGLGEPVWAELRECYSARYLALDRQPAGLFEGAREVLDELRARGHTLAVVTGKGRRGLDRVLAGLELSDYFDATRCADETRSKPDPLMLRELLMELESSVEETLLVGDSEYDLMMAVAAGVESVGVSYGVHGRRRLQAHAPVAVVDRLGELLEFERLSARR